MRIDVRQLSASTLADVLGAAEDGETVLCRSAGQAALAARGASRLGKNLLFELQEDVLALDVEGERPCGAEIMEGGANGL